MKLGVKDPFQPTIIVWLNFKKRPNISTTNASLLKTQLNPSEIVAIESVKSSWDTRFQCALIYYMLLRFKSNYVG